MLTLTAGTAIQGIADTVGAYLFGKIGDRLIDRATMRHTVKRILKNDKRFIRKSFVELQVLPHDAETIAKFLIDDVFQNKEYLYPTSSLPETKQELIWTSFLEKQIIKDRNSLSESKINAIKNTLIECVSHHNELIGKLLLDEGESVILKTIENNQMDLLGYIGRTLNSYAELQSDEIELDYSHKQLEGILHALRMDLRHHKLVLLLSIVGLFVFSFLMILIAPRLFHYANTSTFSTDGLVSEFLILIFALSFAILIFVVIGEMTIIRKAESRINNKTELLWSLLFQYYKEEIIKSNRFNSCEERSILNED